MMQRRSDVIWRVVDGNLVGLDMRSSRYFTLNSSAVLLWDLLEHESEPDELADALVREHHIGHYQAKADVEAFIVSLRQNGLLEGEG